MKWEPVLDEEEEKELKRGFISENTAQSRWETEIEANKEIGIDERILRRNRYRVFNINKFPALAFYSDMRQLRLRKRRNINLTLAANAGLVETCEETVFDNIDDAQTSRGWQGKYTIARITERHEIRQEETGKEKVGRLSGLFSKKKQQEEEERSPWQQ